MRFIGKSALALGLLLSGPALADGLHFVGTAGLSYGGDTLAKIHYTNGDTTQLKAGGLFYFGAGGSYEFAKSPWSAQVLLGHHLDTATAENGDVTFKRNTLDAQVFYRTGNHRLGAGFVRHFSPEYKQSGFYQPDSNAEFDTADGMSLEYNYLPPASKLGVSVRGVLIDYELNSVDGAPASGTYSGNHVAVGLYLYL